jgi:hypothetical protein
MAHSTHVDCHDLFEVHGEIRTRTGTIVLGMIVPIRYNEPLKNIALERHAARMLKQQVQMEIEIQDEVPWADGLTAYDNEHFAIYLKLIDACADNVSEEEMAQAILGIDPRQDPARVRKAVRSHLDRTHWLITSGYKELFAG